MIFDLITKEERDIITYYIEHYAALDHEYVPLGAPLDTILSHWEAAKEEYLIDIFGGKLVLEKDITFEKDYDAIREEMFNLMDGKMPNCLTYDEDIKNFIFEFNEFVQTLVYDNSSPLKQETNVINNFGYETSVAQKEWLDLYYSIYDVDDWIDNKYKGKNFTYTFKVHKDDNIEEPIEIKFKTGSKMFRMLNRIVTVLGGRVFTDSALAGWEKLMLGHSQLLNDKTVKGKLCLSIHPLDYITMSENNYDWTSCMSWTDEGCYRQGTVEMMNSPKVVVAYLRGEKDMLLFNNYSWNNKKWRELFVIDDHLVTDIKGYPYQNCFLTLAALDWLKELSEKAGVFNYDDTRYHYDFSSYNNYACEIDNGDIFHKKGIGICFTTDMMYNDFETIDHYMYIANEFAITEYWEYTCHYSGVAECMHCGEAASYSKWINSYRYDDEDICRLLISPECIKVHSHYECETCGTTAYPDHEMINIDGYYFCPECYETSTRECIDQYVPSLRAGTRHLEWMTYPLRVSCGNKITPVELYTAKEIKSISEYAPEADSLALFIRDGLHNIKFYKPENSYYVDVENLTELAQTRFSWEYYMAYNYAEASDKNDWYKDSCIIIEDVDTDPSYAEETA